VCVTVYETLQSALSSLLDLADVCVPVVSLIHGVVNFDYMLFCFHPCTVRG
jgi:hypothetical protein